MKTSAAIFLSCFFTVTYLAGCRQDTSQDTPQENRQPPAQQVDLNEMVAPEPAAPKKKPDPAFYEAALNGDLDAIRTAIGNDVDINAPDEAGRTALMLASFDGHVDVCELLLKHGADVNARDSVKRTALMYAASGPNESTVTLLLKHNADVNAADNQEHWTALMFAAAEGQTGVVARLLEYEADWQMVDVDGENARDFAASKGHLEVVKLLDAHAARHQDR